MTDFKNKKEKKVVGQLQVVGQSETPGSTAVTVLQKNAAGKVTRAEGATVPTDAEAGFAKGCQFFKTDGAIGTTVYINEGSDSSCDFNVANGLQVAEISITNAEMLALRATPKTLVAAPGAGKILEFISAVLLFDYTGAYTESADNMGVKYENGSGVQVSDDIEATGFVDATADTVTFARKKVDGITAKTGCENKALVLHNTGDGEYGGGNAANAVRVKVTYRVHSTGF